MAKAGWLLIGALLATPAFPQPPARRFALLVGISEYADQGFKWLKFADRDANLFQERTRSLAGGRTWSRVQVLSNKQATKAEISKELRFLIRNAGPNDYVYILISAPGMAVSANKDALDLSGYILTFQGNREHPQQTVLPIDELRYFLQTCLSEHIFLFVDSCRELLATGPGDLFTKQNANQINERLLIILY